MPKIFELNLHTYPGARIDRIKDLRNAWRIDSETAPGLGRTKDVIDLAETENGCRMRVTDAMLGRLYVLILQECQFWVTDVVEVQPININFIDATDGLVPKLY